VVQVGLVGQEGGAAVVDAQQHDPHGVENRNTQCGEAEGDDSKVGVGIADARGVVYAAHAEDAHDDAHHHGSRVADEHLGEFAEHILEEERHQCAHCDKCHHGHSEVVGIEEHASKDEADEDAQTGRESVNTINHVDGIDDAHTGEGAQGQGYVDRQLADAEEAVEVVDVYQVHDDDKTNDGNFQTDSYPRSNADKVVDEAHVHHHRHSDDAREQRVGVEDDAGDTG